MTRGGTETAAGNARAAADGLTHSISTLTQKQKLYLTVLDVFGSHALLANAARNEKYAAMLANLGR